MLSWELQSVVRTKAQRLFPGFCFQNGDFSSPAVSPNGVYIDYVCNQAYDFDPGNGNLIWYHGGPCGGGGGKTSVLLGGRLYARDHVTGNLILDAQTGAALGSFSASAAPDRHCPKCQALAQRRCSRTRLRSRQFLFRRRPYQLLGWQTGAKKSLVTLLFLFKLHSRARAFVQLNSFRSARRVLPNFTSGSLAAAY